MRLLVIGAGGHAKVVVDAARCAGFEVVGVVGEPGGRAELLGIEISHDIAELSADAFIVGIGDNATRARAFAECRERGLTPATVVHPSAIVAGTAVLGAGAFVAAGVVINVDTVIGENAVLNTGCTVDHDCVIADHAHVGPASGLCGGVRVGEGALLGVGVSAVPLATIGAWSVIGAGAAVISDLPANSVCAGVPARVLRRIEARE